MSAKPQPQSQLQPQPQLKVLDRPKLETLSCECYDVVKKETDLLLHYLPQRQVITNAKSIPSATLKTS